MTKSTELTVDGNLVRTLAALLEETGLTEIEYAHGDCRIRVVRGAAQGLTVAVPATAAAGMAPAAPSPVVAAHPGTVSAPMVGTVYLSPQPGAPPFVTVGASVSEGDVLMIIEAMKVMNQIHAARGGHIGQIMVSDGSPVEFGQALLIIE